MNRCFNIKRTEFSCCSQCFALQQGDGLHYQHLVAQLLTRDDAEVLWRLYLGLSECVTVISQQ